MRAAIMDALEQIGMALLPSVHFMVAVLAARFSAPAELPSCPPHDLPPGAAYCIQCGQAAVSAPPLPEHRMPAIGSTARLDLARCRIVTKEEYSAILLHHATHSFWVGDILGSVEPYRCVYHEGQRIICEDDL